MGQGICQTFLKWFICNISIDIVWYFCLTIQVGIWGPVVQPFSQPADIKKSSFPQNTIWLPQVLFGLFFSFNVAHFLEKAKDCKMRGQEPSYFSSICWTRYVWGPLDHFLGPLTPPQGRRERRHTDRQTKEQTFCN